MGRSLLQSMVRDKTFSLDQQSLNSVENLAELFSQARGFEQDTVFFYEFLKDIVDDQEVKQQLDVIIKEENRHVVILGKLAANELVDDLLASSGPK